MCEHPEQCGCRHDNEEVVICRCEEITKKQIEAAIAAGCHDLDAVKRATRAGMGMCQSKSCTPVISRLIANKTGIKPSEIPPFTKRAPLRPISACAFNREEE